MDVKGLKELLAQRPSPCITVFGDYCLDKYLYIDPALDEPSVETGLTAYQVTHAKTFAGAAGTITNNLRALGAQVRCVGMVGQDGEGYELMARLKEIGADTSYMVSTPLRQTCTYMKPMRGAPGRETELNRLDMRNFTRTPESVEEALIESLGRAVSGSRAVIICDQFVEPDQAAVTGRVREAIADMALKHGDVIWYADSRGHIDLFRNVMVKCNHKEIAAIFGENPDAIGAEEAAGLAGRLYRKNQRPVIVTMGERGLVAFDGAAHHVPAFKVEGEVDICGAGDACNAGLIFALTLGAALDEAALMGNACSGIVIKQIGVTGTATIDGVLAKLAEYSA